jgi:hypothetical protein
VHVTCTTGGSADCKKQYWRAKGLSSYERVTRLMGCMTLADKLGQVLLTRPEVSIMNDKTRSHV